MMNTLDATLLDRCYNCGEWTDAADGLCDPCYGAFYNLDLPDEDPDLDYPEDNLSDVLADSMTLAGAGWGTDEDYGYFGDDY